MAQNALENVKKLKKGRTDSSIETFENKVARTLLAYKAQQIDAKLDLITKKEKCEKIHQQDKNNGMESDKASKKLADCTLKAIKSYEETITKLQDDFSIDHSSLTGELENTLNNPLYSQEFDAYWR